MRKGQHGTKYSFSLTEWNLIYLFMIPCYKLGLTIQLILMQERICKKCRMSSTVPYRMKKNYRLIYFIYATICILRGTLYSTTEQLKKVLLKRPQFWRWELASIFIITTVITRTANIFSIHGMLNLKSHVQRDIFNFISFL